MDCLRKLCCLVACWSLVPACVVYIEEEPEDAEPEHETIVFNHRPQILADATWWTCDYDWVADDHFFEFEAIVDDPDGSDDVVMVSMTLYEAGTDYVLDSFALHAEGAGVWGGLVWESESYAFCGESLDVLVEAVDYYDDWDLLWLLD